MTEEVKRLNPTPETLRELYLKSGNICAFPGCLHPIIDNNGVYIAQMCHIEAANEGGQRFNPSQSNEQRRAYENLVLMCHRHHKVTDDITKYTVDKMREIKRQHEAKFEKVLDSLANDIYDVAFAYQPIKPKSINSLISSRLIIEEERESVIEEINELIRLLNQISPATRKILLLVIQRVDNHKYEFSINEFTYIVSISPKEAYNHIAILERYGFLYDNEDSDQYERKLCINKLTKKSPYPIVLILKEFCTIKSIELSTMIVDLNFSAIDNN